ncbi:competence protein [Elizabethkingia miricola]|uniref:ComEC/Rec2 family competence protein n=1 Tax=Elizabethkingia miricola TaxID=172045 RepID=A0ABD5B100_ELIMR|nr:ComEC/Rec2 family competence protein [Elizabethkingia miricola]MDQ8747112.1 ComEC/Rec2 family competence protein [Elizabethkingia miricola]OPB85253.1 competence protein [Elizabethkingia miricola]
MKKQPVFCLFISFSIGILTGDEFSADKNAAGFVMLVVVVCFLISFCFKKGKAIAFMLFFIFLGQLSHLFNAPDKSLSDFKGKKAINFQIVKKLNSTEENRRYIVYVSAIGGEGKLVKPFYAVYSLKKNRNPLDFTHTYSGIYYINKIKPPQNDYQFSYQKYMLRNNVAYQIYSKEEPIAIKKNASLAYKVRQIRLDVLQHIDNSALSKESRDFLKGIILADRTDMDTGVSADFTKTGLVHFLAISGTHMVIIFWLLMIVLKRSIPLKFKNITVIISLVLIWIFAVFIDYGSSVVRSCLMLTFYYIMVLLQRKPDLLHSMALSGLIILIADTQQLFDIGFQLSFLAVFGIYWLNRPILNCLPKARNSVHDFFLQVVSITLSAQLITLPLILYYFHQFSLVSVIANLVVVPLSEIIIVFSLLMVFVLSFFGDVFVINFLYDQLTIHLLKLIHFFAQADFLFFDDIPMSLLEVILLFVLLYLLRFLIKERRDRRVLQFCFVVCLFFLLRLGLNIHAFHKEEFLSHQYFNQKIFSVRKNAKAVFFFADNLDKNKIENYLVKPYVVSRRIKNYEIIYFNTKEFDQLKYRNEIKSVK